MDPVLAFLAVLLGTALSTLLDETMQVTPKLATWLERVTTPEE